MSGYGGNYDFNSSYNSLYSNANDQSTLNNNTNSFNVFLNSIHDSTSTGNGGSGGVDVYGQHQQQQQHQQHHQLQDQQQQQQQHHHDHHLQQQQQQPPQQQHHLNYQYSSKPQHQHHQHHHLQQPPYSTGGTTGVSQNMFYQDRPSLSSLMNNMNNRTPSNGGDAGRSIPAPAIAATTLGNHGAASAEGNNYMSSSSSVGVSGAPPPSSSTGYMLHQPAPYDSNAMEYFALLQQHHQPGQQRQPRGQQPKQPQHYEFNRELNDYENWDATPLPTTQQQEISSNQCQGQKSDLSNINNNGSFCSSSDVADFALNFFDQNCNFDEIQEPLSQKKSSAHMGTNAVGNNLPLSNLTDPSEIERDIIDTISSISHYNPTSDEGPQNPYINNNKKPSPQSDVFSGFTMNIISLSQEPLSAHEIIEKVSFRCNEVLTRFLPCVEFLVACQQELRAGLAMVVQKNGRGRSIYSAQEFYKTYFEPLNVRFYNRNKGIMPSKELQDSYDGIKNLLRDVKKAEQKGNFEGMKNSFLGGMRDGESWGLRKWLSKNGGALKICNDVELIWGGLRELNREETTTKELARILRPKAKHALKRLQDGVPKAYQEISTAHPYLPFFHRLECALKGLSEFDPEDDDVICIDDSDSEDDEVQEIKVVKKPAEESVTQGAAQLLNTFDNQSITSTLRTANKFQLASSVDEVASAIEAGNEIRPPNINFDEYWTRPNNYILVLRLFQKILLERTVDPLLDYQSHTKSYVAVIKNPLCFRDIVLVLSECQTQSQKKKGLLPSCPNLKRWNIFEGKYLIQAVDLVFLNNLAILGKNPNVTRTSIQTLRSNFWKEIRRAASTEKKCVPTRRTETSEFVIHK